MVVHWGPRGPIRPRSPEREKRFQRLRHLHESNPELFRLEVARMKASHSSRRKPLEMPRAIVSDPPEIIQQRRRALLETIPPAPVCFAPSFLTDLREATCATKAQAEMYKRLANTCRSGLKVMNMKTGLVDEEFSARMIKRYREDPGESSVTAVAASGHVDEESTAHMMKHNREVPGMSSVTAVAASGIADEVREGLSKLKLKHYELGESSGTVVTTSGNKDKMLCDCA